MRIKRFLPLIHVVGFLLLLSACTNSPLYQPLPEELENKAQVKGFANVRAWGDQTNSAMVRGAAQSLRQMKKANHGELPSEINALALSGGGADGAFGAGLLYGWSKRGTRPKFQLVTGISTGALIAPLAFLGPKYDNRLKHIYTNLSEKELFEFNNPVRILFSFVRPVLSPSIASNRPMKKLMEEIVTQEMLNEIAKEHLKGRRLFIGTTQMNAQRLVIWDIGAIAVSKNPRALSLVHKILLSSSALPGVFPPQYFHVTANGYSYKEMHVDGGVETQVMLYEQALTPYADVFLEHEKNVVKKLFIIRNRKVSPEWENVWPSLDSIMARVVWTLTKTQGIGDIYRLYYYSRRDHFDFNLAYIPENFNEHSNKIYDKDYMVKLFEVGERLGRKGYPWKKKPPKI